MVDKSLVALLQALNTWRTAKALSVKLECSKPIAYKRLSELERRGFQVETKYVREGQSGPKAKSYRCNVGRSVKKIREMVAEQKT